RNLRVGETGQHGPVGAVRRKIGPERLGDILLDDNLSDDQRKMILRITGAGQALITILNDILDLSKIQVGKLEIEYIDFDLHQLISESLDLFYRKASDKGIALGSKIATDLPHGFIGDPTRIRQILVNLIGNAVKFTERGSVTLDVSVSEQTDERVALQFEVVDTGIGIQADHQDGLFQDFAQLDASTARKYEGTGLGLAISKRLTELMGGEIGVKSIDGKGSIFWFTVHGRPSNMEVATTTEAISEKEYRATRSLDILLAEDNDLNQMIMTAVLSKFDHHITVADNGRAAVEAVSKDDFDLILMDIRMPEMDGPDATRTIRQQPNSKAGIPIITVTADAVVENRQDYFDAGMNACTTKPINLPELLDAINRVLDEEVHISE
ncbi:MAG: response regulator, partial [Rhodospirillaceae bacterium]|nr:response regulator [Rhodospirillaceae bacterium]